MIITPFNKSRSNEPLAMGNERIKRPEIKVHLKSKLGFFLSITSLYKLHSYHLAGAVQFGLPSHPKNPKKSLLFSDVSRTVPSDDSIPVLPLPLLFLSQYYLKKSPNIYF